MNEITTRFPKMEAKVSEMGKERKKLVRIIVVTLGCAFIASLFGIVKWLAPFRAGIAILLYFFISLILIGVGALLGIFVETEKEIKVFGYILGSAAIAGNLGLFIYYSIYFESFYDAWNTFLWLFSLAFIVISSITAPILTWIGVSTIGEFQVSYHKSKIAIERKILGIEEPLCKQCGFKLKDKSTFCSECGAKIEFSDIQDSSGGVE